MIGRPPLIDHHHRSLWIPRRLMPPILAVHGGHRPDAAALKELREIGVIATRPTDPHHLDPLVSNLLDVMTNPSLVVTAEVTTRGSLRRSTPRLATFWQNGPKAVAGLAGDRRQFQLIEVEPALLPFHIAQAVGLSPRRHPQFSGSFSLPSAVLNHAEDLVAVDPDRLALELSNAGIPRHWAERLIAALTLRRSLWVLESIWLRADATRDETRLCVLDGGFSGFWAITEEAEGLLTISPTHFDRVLNRIASLLP